MRSHVPKRTGLSRSTSIKVDWAGLVRMHPKSTYILLSALRCSHTLKTKPLPFGVSPLQGPYLSDRVQRPGPGYRGEVPVLGEPRGKSLCCTPWKWQASGGPGSRPGGDLAGDTGRFESEPLLRRTQSTTAKTNQHASPRGNRQETATEVQTQDILQRCSESICDESRRRREAEGLDGGKVFAETKNREIPTSWAACSHPLAKLSGDKRTSIPRPEIKQDETLRPEDVLHNRWHDATVRPHTPSAPKRSVRAQLQDFIRGPFPVAVIILLATCAEQHTAYIAQSVSEVRRRRTRFTGSNVLNRSAALKRTYLCRSFPEKSSLISWNQSQRRSRVENKFYQFHFQELYLFFY